jgi:uncharacterized repeat protein (TIGR01451 family)/fimbrial isopeptide formation D2 family protein/LPXTG-motif cell wall-anchored protein
MPPQVANQEEKFMSAVLQRPSTRAGLRRVFGMVVAFLALLSGLAVGAPLAVPDASASPTVPIGPNFLQPDGTCPPEGFLVQRPEGWTEDGFFNRVDLVSKEVVETPLDYGMNGAGYNVLDDYIYGTTLDLSIPRGGMTRIHGDGTQEYLGHPIGYPANQGMRWISGDINLNGRYVVGNGGDSDGDGFLEWFVVDMNPASATYFNVLGVDGPDADTDIDPILVPAPVPALPGEYRGNPDLAYVGNVLYQIFREFRYDLSTPDDPLDGEIVGMQLFRLNINAAATTGAYVDQGSVTQNGQPFPDAGFGALYVDRINNHIYGSSNADGDIYRIDLDTREIVLFTEDEPTAQNDGARCQNAPLDIDWGDAPEIGYGTLAMYNGPRHTGIAGLALGATVDFERDALSNPDASGDDATDDEDAFGPGPITLNSNAPAVTVPYTNTTGGPVTIAGWLDLNGDRDFFDAGERQFVTLAPGAPANLAWGPANGAGQNTFARFRLYQGTIADPQPLGAGTKGEVEDYPVTLTGSYTVSKTASVASESVQGVGTQITYTISVTNQGSVPLPGGSFVDPLGNVLDDATMVTPPAASNGFPVNYDGTTLSWNGTVPVGGFTVSYTVQINNTLTNGVLWNWVEGPGCVGQSTAPPCGHRVHTGSYTVSKSADVANGTTVLPGQVINYTITVTPTGAVGVPATFTDDLSGILDDATLVAAPVASGGTGGIDPATNVLSWSGTPTIGTPITVTYSVQVNPTLRDGLLRNAVVGLGCPAGTTAPPCAWTHLAGTYTVSKTADVADGTTVPVGQVINYTITVTPAGAVGVPAGFTDDLSRILDDATLVSGPVASGGTGGIDPATNVLSWSGTPTIGTPITITYGVQVNNALGDGFLENAVVGLGCPAGTLAPPCAIEHRAGTYTVAKSADVPDGTTVPTGQVINYRIRVTRSGSTDVVASFTDNLGNILDDATVVTPPAASDGSAVSFAGGVISWTGTIPANVSFVDITYGVRVNDPVGDGRLENAVVGLGCPAGTLTPPCAIEHYAGSYSIAKTSNPPSGTLLVPGQQVQYTIAVTQRGAGAVSNAAFSDSLAAVLDDATLTSAIAADIGTATLSGTTINWTAPTLAPGAVATITYTVTVKPADQLGASDGVLTNGVSGANCAPTAPGCFVTHPTRAWTVVKTATPPTGTQVSPSSAIAYRLTVTNTGGSTITDAALTDSLGGVLDDATLTSGPTASSGSAALSGSTITWSSPSFTTDQVVTIDYTVTLDAYADLGDGLLNNVVVAPEAGCPAQPAGPTCSTSHSTPQLQYNKTSNAASPVRPGDEVTYTITVTNTGTATVPSVPVTDDLSAVLDDATLVGSPTGPGTAPVITGNVLTWSGPVAPGVPAVITYTVRVKTAVELGTTPNNDGVLRNAAVIPRTPCVDGQPACPPNENAIDAWTYVKDANPPADSVVEPGDEITYTITITNTGGLPLTGKSVVDDMSDVLDDAELTGQPTVRVGGTGDASFSLPNETITWIGDLPLGQVVYVDYTVTVRPAYQLSEDAVIGNLVTTTTGGECTDPPPCRLEHKTDAWDALKESDSTDVVPGATVNYTITVTNFGSEAVTGALWTDDLTDVIDDATFDDATLETTGGDVDYDETTSTITWSGDLAVDQVVTITYSVVVNKPFSGNGHLDNAVFTPDGPCESLTPIPERCLEQLPGKQLTIVKATDPVDLEYARPGDVVWYTVTITNTGQLDYPTLKNDVAAFEDDLTSVLDDADGPTPEQITVEGPGVAGFDPVTGILDWTGPLLIGEEAVVRYAITVHEDVTGDAMLLNVVASDTPGSLCPDPAITDPEAEGYDPNCVRPLPIQAYEVAKTSDPADGDVVQPGDRVTYTLTITSTGEADYAAVTVTDEMADVLDDATLDGAPVASAGTASISGTTLTWKGALPARDIVTVTYSVIVKPPTGLVNAQIRNVVTGSENFECAPAIGEDDQCETHHDVAAYSTVKEVVSPEKPMPGDQVTYRITITSTGTAPILGETITDDLSWVLDDAVWDNTASFTASNPATTGAFLYNAPSLSWTGDIAVDDVLAITYTVTLNPDVTGDGWLRNVVSSNDCRLVAPSGSPLAFANAAMPPNCRTETPVHSVVFAKTVSPAGPFKPGDVVTYTITATNNGQANLDGITWSDDMTRVLDDADMNGQPSADRGSVSYSVPLVNWTGSLAVSEVARVTYSVTIKDHRGDGSMPNGVVGAGPGSNCPSVGAAIECQTLALVLPAGVDLDPTEPGELPRTGGNTSGIVLVASMLLAAGVGLVAVRRRRRSIMS